jgi:anti-sigma factor RsiW
MTVETSHGGIEALLAAYALDAVDEDEVAAVDRHLAECAGCRREVAAHREAAVLLADEGTSSPAGVWERIRAEIDQPTPRPELPRRWRERRPRS